MPTRTPKRALAAVFAAVALVTSVFAVPGVCAEPPADVVVGFVDRPEPGYYSRTIMPTLAAMARAMPDRTVTGVRLSPDDPIADLMRLRPDILVAPASVYMELELNYGGHAIATRKTRWADNPSASVGAAVVVRADNNEIRTLADLRGRRMASGGADAVDGWLALAYELKERRLRPESYRAHTAFLNFPMPDVISAVLSGKVEAACSPPACSSARSSRGFSSPELSESWTKRPRRAFPAGTARHSIPTSSWPRSREPLRMSSRQRRSRSSPCPRTPTSPGRSPLTLSQ